MRRLRRVGRSAGRTHALEIRCDLRAPDFAAPRRVRRESHHAADAAARRRLERVRQVQRLVDDLRRMHVGDPQSRRGETGPGRIEFDIGRGPVAHETAFAILAIDGHDTACRPDAVRKLGRRNDRLVVALRETRRTVGKARSEHVERHHRAFFRVAPLVPRADLYHDVTWLHGARAVVQDQLALARKQYPVVDRLRLVESRRRDTVAAAIPHAIGARPHLRRVRRDRIGVFSGIVTRGTRAALHDAQVPAVRRTRKRIGQIAVVILPRKRRGRVVPDPQIGVAAARPHGCFMGIGRRTIPRHLRAAALVVPGHYTPDRLQT